VAKKDRDRKDKQVEHPGTANGDCGFFQKWLMLIKNGGTVTFTALHLFR
jgi:hypothetical protein